MSGPMKRVQLTALPDCDIHTSIFGETGVKARFDGPTRFGQHGYMCGDCFEAYGLSYSSLNRALYVVATHHGPWCDESETDEMCPRCRAYGGKTVPTDVGWWLFARMAVHHHYNQRLPKNRQDVLPGLGLSIADNLEVAQLSLELGRLRAASKDPW